MKYLNLIRYKNLIMMAMVMLLIYHCVICPSLAVFGLESNVNTMTFVLLLLGTVAIAAGGYVINDYFDIKIDRINHPEHVIVSNTIDKPKAMRIYQILTVVGIALGLASSAMLRSMTIALIFILVPGMLWFYSASYKRQLFIGNLIVALLTALVPLLPLIAEASALQNNYSDLIRQTPVLNTIYSYVCGFALFALLLTMAREIIKDLEDEPGDKEMECRTIAIVWGDMYAKIIATTIILTVNILVAFAVYKWMPLAGTISRHYFWFGIAAPSICSIAVLWSKTCTAFRNASAMVKFIMCIGVLYSVVYYFILAQVYGIKLFGILQIVQN